MAFDDKSHAGGRDSLDPLGAIEQTHFSLKSVCDQLEKIADHIKDELARGLALDASTVLRRDLPLLFRQQERALFPILAKRSHPDEWIDRVLAELRDERLFDEGYSIEVLELLDLLANGDVLHNAEMAGYLLRGFFVSLRRHLHWQEAIVFHLARQRLTSDDLSELSRLLAESGSETRL